MERIGKWLVVERIAPRRGRVTPRWILKNTKGHLLGYIGWYPAWRQYVLAPAEGTCFNAGCLQDITRFLARINREQKDKAGQGTETKGS